jgi:hypothetical protein
MKPILLAVAFALMATRAVAAYDDPGQAQFEKDRQSILAMTGTFKVTFDMRETVPFVADYTPIPAKVVSGHEVVRVAEDTGTTIMLQHLLVATDDKGKTIIVKHWRQDWVYQPAHVMAYVSDTRWVNLDTTPAQRAGAWSQTVWQTDDSPRYGGIGVWAYDDGVARWTSDYTMRPLARRDAVRHPIYDHYMGTNRHAITPTGWVHEQDNAKIGMKDGKSVTFVHEVVLNTYTRDDKFDVAAADTYWKKTKDYWAAVRGLWDDALTRNGAITVALEPENGTVTGPKLMGLADDIVAGKTTTKKAIAEARVIIQSTSVAAK